MLKLHLVKSERNPFNLLDHYRKIHIRTKRKIWLTSIRDTKRLNIRLYIRGSRLIILFKLCPTFSTLKGSKLCIGAFTLLTSRFSKSRHFDPTIYTEVSVSQNFAIFWLVVRMCDHRLQCMHSCMQRMQYAWGPRISIHVSKSARS